MKTFLKAVLFLASFAFVIAAIYVAGGDAIKHPVVCGILAVLALICARESN